MAHKATRITLGLVAALLFAPHLLQADVWRCEGNAFTNRPSSAEGCEKFQGSRVCGNGLNRFYTPERAGLRSSPETCTPLAPAFSPFAGAPLPSLRPIPASFSLGSLFPKDDEEPQRRWNWERKLEPTLSLASNNGKSLQDEFAGELAELQGFLSKIPGGERILEALAR